MGTKLPFCTRAAAMAMSLLAHHGRSAQLSDFPGIADGEFSLEVMQRAQSMLETYQLDYWPDVRASLQTDLAKKLSLTNPSPLDSQRLGLRRWRLTRQQARRWPPNSAPVLNHWTT